jgi:hypothetical protein
MRNSVHIFCSQMSVYLSLSFNELSTTQLRRMGEWRYSFTILDLGTKWNRGIRFTPRLLYLRESSPPVPVCWVGLLAG